MGCSSTTIKDAVNKGKNAGLKLAKDKITEHLEAQEQGSAPAAQAEAQAEVEAQPEADQNE